MDLQAGENSGSNPLRATSFCVKVNFDDVLSVLTRLQPNFPTLLVQHIVNFILVKQEQRGRGENSGAEPTMLSKLNPS